MDIVFFGTGPVAAESLRLLAQDFDIEMVITKPRPAHHKGNVPVLELAEKLQLPVLTVANKQELSQLFKTHSFKSRVGVLIDFGIIVAQDVIDYFPLGIINSHFSLLPEWRGADPITFAVLSGQKTTGVSLMLLVEKMDEGPLLAFKEYELSDDITTQNLTDKLIKLSQELLAEHIPCYLDGTVKPQPQSITGLKVSYSRKITKEDGVIDWNKPAAQIEREIRAYLGWPGSRTTLAGKDVIVTQAHVVASQPPEAKPGDVTVVPQANVIMICTGNGSLCIERLKPAGKSEMTAQAFLAGHKHLL